MTQPVDDEFTEIYDADIPRVDLVGKAANGMRFLIAKSEDGQAGMFDPEFVRSLVAKADTDPAGERVTISGTPGAIADMIHKAAMSTSSINDLPDSAFAYIEPGGSKDDEGKTTPRSLRHFPIQDAAHVRDALSRAPQSEFGDKAMPKIRRAAEKFDIDVSKEQPMTQPTADVAKADGPDLEVGDVVADAPTGSTADSVPGSPDWEQLDGETAWQAISVLGRAKAAVEWLISRENQESVTVGDTNAAADSSMAAYDLGEVCCAIDYAISCLGAFAAGEKLEADMADELEAVGKALARLEADLAPLSTLEQFAPVVKAGRVLSSANESAIRGAVEQLQKVLASLPSAPEVDDAAGQVAKAKETEVTQPVEKTAAEPIDAKSSEPAAPAVVEKAKGDPQVAVYDANGNLVGVADPSAITPLSDAKAPGAEPADMEPAPAAEVGTPAEAAPPAAPAAPAPVAPTGDDDVTKTTEPDAATELIKSTVDSLVKAALDEYSAQQAELVKGLEDRLTKVEETPAPPKVGSNGMPAPRAEDMRGQDAGAPPADVAKAEQLREQLLKAKTPAEREAIANEMNQNAAAALAAVHATRQ